MTYHCGKCGSEKTIITGRAKQVDVYPIEGPHYEVRCHECGDVQWSAHPEIIERWANRHREQTTVRTGLPDITWRKLHEGVLYGGAAGGGNMQDIIMRTLQQGNDLIAELPFKKPAPTRLHSKVTLDAKQIAVLKRTAPTIFPEYNEWRGAQRRLQKALEEVRRTRDAWIALGKDNAES